MQKIKKSILLFLIFITPTLSFAKELVQKGLVPCNNTADKSGFIAEPCDFNSLMKLVNTVLQFVLYDMVIPISAIMLAYAGFKMITAGGESGARTKAKDTFSNVVIGLIIAVAAFLIIRTVLSILGYKGDWIGFDPISGN